MASPVLGIIGGIGSGKSVVATEFLKHGGVLIAGDQLGHEALRQADIQAQLVARWGKQVLDSGGALDRKRVAGIVFADPAELRALEKLTHPYIERRIREEVAAGRANPAVRLIVLDAAILLEAGWHDVCDFLVFVDSPRALRLERLQRQRGWTADELEKREHAQLPLAAKRAHANAIVKNDNDVAAVAAQVRRLLVEWQLLEPRRSD